MLIREGKTAQTIQYKIQHYRYYWGFDKIEGNGGFFQTDWINQPCLFYNTPENLDTK